MEDFKTELINGTPLKATMLQPFNGLSSKTNWVCGCQKGRTIPDFDEARDDGWK